jgi:hypothetical protein
VQSTIVPKKGRSGLGIAVQRVGKRSGFAHFRVRLLRPPLLRRKGGYTARVLLECQKCGAPLDAKGDEPSIRCRYCEAVHKPKKLRTLAMQTPPGWTPPPVWQPPPAAHFHAAPLPLRPVTAASTSARKRLVLAPLIASMSLGLTGVVVAALANPAMRDTVGGALRRATGTQYVATHGTLTRADLDLAAARAPGPEGHGIRKRVVFTGTQVTNGEGTGCRGLRDAQPALAIQLDQPRILRIVVVDGDDVRLQVRDAHGNVAACSEFIGEPPSIVRRFEVGTFYIFPTSGHSVRAQARAVIEVEGIDAQGGVDGGLVPAAAPRAGAIDLGATPERELAGRLQAEVAPERSGACAGAFGVTPDLLLDTRVMRAVRIDAVSVGNRTDLVLLLRRPDGSRACDDDSGGSHNPRLSLGLPPGKYPVWVGARHAERAAQGSAYRVTVTSVPIEGGSLGADGLVEGGVPTLGVMDLDDPRGLRSATGKVQPWLDAATLGSGCSGHVALLRDVAIRTSRPRRVRIRTRAPRMDTTLLTRDAAGFTRCDDDSGGRNDALVEATLPTGETSVWVGLRRPERARGPVTVEVEAVDR